MAALADAALIAFLALPLRTRLRILWTVLVPGLASALTVSVLTQG